MPYIPVTTEADRSFASDADAMSGRIDNRGWQASNIFADNRAAMAVMPYRRELQDMMLARGEMLAQSRMARKDIAADDTALADEASFKAFNEGLGDLSQEQYNEKLGTALRDDPINRNLQAARAALSSTVSTSEAIGQNAFQTRQRDAKSKLTDWEMEDATANRDVAHETALVTAGTSLQKAQLEAAKTKQVFTGTPDDLHNAIGASGMSPENKMAMSQVVQVLGTGPEALDAFNALRSVVAGLSSQREAGRYFQERIKPYQPAIQEIQQTMGVGPNGALFSPFDPNPQVREKLRAALIARPDLAGPLADVMGLHRDYQANEQSMVTLEQELPKAMGLLLERARDMKNGKGKVDFDQQLGKFKAVINMYAGGVAENMRDYAETYKLRMDQSKIDALDSRLKNAMDANEIAKTRLELAKDYPEIKERTGLINMIMTSDKVRKLTPEKQFEQYKKTVEYADKFFSKSAPTTSKSGSFSGESM